MRSFSVQQKFANFFKEKKYGTIMKRNWNQINEDLGECSLTRKLPAEMWLYIFYFIQQDDLRTWKALFMTCKSLKYLSEAAFDPSRRENSLLLWSCQRGYAEKVMHLLSDSRVDPTVGNVWRGTALERASANGHLNVVKILLQDSRIDPSAHDNFAVTWAKKNKHEEVVSELAKNAKVKEQLAWFGIPNAGCRLEGDLEKMGWCGDLNRTDADKILRNHHPGTYLMRWSDHTKSFVLSYCQASGSEVVGHMAYIHGHGDGSISTTFSNGSIHKYSSVDEFLKYLIKEGVITNPVDTTEALQIIRPQVNPMEMTANETATERS